MGSHRHQPHGHELEELLGIGNRTYRALLVYRRLLRHDRQFFEVTQKLKFDVWTVHPYDITISVDTAATFGFTLLAAVIGTVHFLRNSYKDKIRTRMIYEMLITLAAFTAALAVLQPANAGQLTGILIVNASILAGHFFALTCTRFTNIAFILLALLALAATAFNMSNLTPAANNLSPWSL